MNLFYSFLKLIVMYLLNFSVNAFKGFSELLEKDLDEDPCLLIQYNMTTTDMEKLDSISRSDYPVMVFDRGAENNWMWRSLWKCFVGISHMDHAMGLQDMLSDLPHRRMVFLKTEKNNDNGRGFSKQEIKDLTALDRRHHPPVIFSHNGEATNLFVSCRSKDKPPKLVKVDFWIDTRWKFQQDIGEENLEKLCNGGHHEMYGKDIVASVFGLYPRMVVLRQFQPPKLGGLVIDLADVLAKHLGFNIHFKMTRTWGNLLPNGTLVGTRGDVQNGYADMGLEIVVNYPRGPGAVPAEGNMTNTNFWTWRIFNFLTIKPKQDPPWLNIMLPLDTMSWIATICSIILMSIIFTLMSFKEAPYKANKFLAALDLTLMTLVALWHQYRPNWRAYHGEIYPRKITKGSLLHLFWVVIAFLLFEFYKSNLKASLMIKKYGPSIFNIKEVLDRDMPVHLQDLILQKFETYHDYQSVKIVEQVKRKGVVIPASPNIVVDTENAVLKHGGAGYFYDELLVLGRSLYHARGEPYPLEFMTERYSTDFDGIVLPYQSPRLHILNPVMRRIYESGIIFVLYDKYKLDMTTLEKEHEAKFENKSLTMSHFTIPALVLLAGWLISGPICLVEVLNRQSQLRRVRQEPGHRLNVFVKSYTLGRVKRLSQH